MAQHLGALNQSDSFQDPALMSLSALGVTRVNSHTSSRRTDSGNFSNNNSFAGARRNVMTPKQANASSHPKFTMADNPPIVITPADNDEPVGEAPFNYSFSERRQSGGVIPSISNSTAAPSPGVRGHRMSATSLEESTQTNGNGTVGKVSSKRGSFFNNADLKNSVRLLDGNATPEHEATNSPSISAPASPKLGPDFSPPTTTSPHNSTLRSLLRLNRSGGRESSTERIGSVDVPLICFVMLEEDVFKISEGTSRGGGKASFALPVPPSVRVDTKEVLRAFIDDAASVNNSSFSAHMNSSFHSAGSWCPRQSSSVIGKDSPSPLETVLVSPPYNGLVRPYFIDPTQMVLVDGTPQLKPTCVDHLIKGCLREFPAWKYRLVKAHEAVEEFKRFQHVAGGKIAAVAKASRENKSIHGPLFPSSLQERKSSPVKHKFELALLDDYHRFYNVILSHLKRFPSHHQAPSSDLTKILEEVPGALGGNRILQDIVSAWSSIHHSWREEAKFGAASIATQPKGRKLASTTSSTVLHHDAEVKLSYPHEQLMNEFDKIMSDDEGQHHVPIFVLRTAGSTPFMKLSADSQQNLQSTSPKPPQNLKYLPLDSYGLSNQQLRDAAQEAPISTFRAVPPVFIPANTPKRKVVPLSLKPPPTSQSATKGYTAGYITLSPRRSEEELFIFDQENPSRRGTTSQPNFSRNVKIPKQLIGESSPLVTNAADYDSQKDLLGAVLREIFGEDVQEHSHFRANGSVKKFKHRFWNLEQMITIKNAFEEHCKDREAHVAARKHQDELQHDAKERILASKKNRQELLARIQREQLFSSPSHYDPSKNKPSETNTTTIQDVLSPSGVHESPILHSSPASPSDPCPVDLPPPMSDEEILSLPKIEVPVQMSLPLSYRNQRLLLQKGCPFFREQWGLCGLPQPSANALKDPFSPSPQPSRCNFSSSIPSPTVSEVAERAKQNTAGVCDFCGALRAQHTRLLEEDSDFTKRVISESIIRKRKTDGDSTSNKIARDLFGSVTPPPRPLTGHSDPPTNSPSKKEDTNVGRTYSNWKDSLREQEERENLLISNLLNRENRTYEKSPSGHKGLQTSPTTPPRLVTPPRKATVTNSTRGISPSASPLYSRLSIPRKPPPDGLHPKRDLITKSTASRMQPVVSCYHNPCGRFIPLWGNNEACQNCYVSRIEHPDVLNSLSLAQRQKEDRRAAIRKKKRAAFVFHEVLPWPHILSFCTTNALCQLSLVNYYVGGLVKPILIATVQQILELDSSSGNWKTLVLSEADSISAALLTPIGHLFINSDSPLEEGEKPLMVKALPTRRMPSAQRDNRQLAEVLLDLIAVWSVSKGPLQFSAETIQSASAAALSAKAKEHIRKNQHNLPESGHIGEEHGEAEAGPGVVVRLANSMSETLYVVVKHASFKDLTPDLIASIQRARDVVTAGEEKLAKEEEAAITLLNPKQRDDTWRDRYWNKSLYLLLRFFESLVKEKRIRELASKYISRQTKESLEKQKAT